MTDPTTPDVFVPVESEPDEPRGPGADDEAAADPFAIDPLKLPDLPGQPSGRMVRFRSLATVTQENVKWLRAALNSEGNGDFINMVLQRAMELFVVEWDLELPLPRNNPKITGRLAWADAHAIERHLQKPIRSLIDPNAATPGE